MGIQIKNKDKWSRVLLWGSIFVSTLILLSLCFNEGLDYDEAYSYRTVHDNSITGIWNAILQAKDTDIPLWYCSLKVWSWFFGESFFAYKMFSLAGTVATMVLGSTLIRRIWGNKTALLFILSVSLSPALMHISVNIRMYTWTIFLVTLCALTAYLIVQNPVRRGFWLLLFLTTITSLFSHYFTAFCLLFIYLYLFIELLRTAKKHIWKMLASGAISAVCFLSWLFCADFFHLVEGEEATALSMEKVDFEDMFWFVFHTNVENSHYMGMGIVLLAFVCLFLFRARFRPGERRFLLLCLGIFPASYLTAGILASAANHFFIPRHVMHGVGLMWLGLAIIFSKVNWKTCAAYLLYIVIMAVSSYGISYKTEYLTIPYLEETKEFIAQNMEPGDVVIYNSDDRFGLLYGCYMPEQIFYYFTEAPDLQELAGKRVWFFLCRDLFFTEETQEQYGITYENMGHYGFQIMGDSTDFDILRLEIRGMENEN